ncbi:hypothetical protein N431DRAFT_512908 [Stipitochalara longipes BDJ]|nr:hypothetical protein N431DRAFT_512908 [Stipitochalara longipes BDJ]
MSSNTDIQGECTEHLQNNEIASPTFAPFPKLPLEPRLRIWGLIDDFISHEVRITVTTPSRESDIKKKPTFRLHTPLPSILHICHESRTQGLKIYKTLFKIKDRASIERDEIYFNPTRDSVFISIPRCTRDWIIYTGGHIHLTRTGTETPFDSHNILRCQVSTLTLGYGKHEVETIVVVQPTLRPFNILNNERSMDGFDSLAMVAGPAWSSVEYFVWKPEWWNEHWEFLFSELVKEDPLPTNSKKKAGKRVTKSRKGRKLVGW